MNCLKLEKEVRLSVPLYDTCLIAEHFIGALQFNVSSVMFTEDQFVSLTDYLDELFCSRNSSVSDTINNLLQW